VAVPRNAVRKTAETPILKVGRLAVPVAVPRRAVKRTAEVASFAGIVRVPKPVPVREIKRTADVATRAGRTRVPTPAPLRAERRTAEVPRIVVADDSSSAPTLGVPENSVLTKSSVPAGKAAPALRPDDPTARW
jgi:hypothetical protein